MKIAINNVVEKESVRPPRGRPPVEKGKARRNRVVTFLTDRELANLKTLAMATNDTLSGACYQLLKKKLSQSMSDQPDPGEE